MRFAIALLFALLAVAAQAAPVAQLAFEQGNTILINPDADAITLRSAATDRVRLQLYRVPDETAENQIAAARAAQTITETGLLARVTTGRTPQWQADFILPNESSAVTQPIPLMAAAGALAAGDYVLLASTPTSSVAQWFSITPLTLAHNAAATESQSTVVETTTLKPLPNAVIVALNAKGEVIGGARADDDAIARWAVPADTVILRADATLGETKAHAFLPLATPTPPAPVKNSALTITPDFSNGTAPAGATARFDLQVKNGAGRTISYTFAADAARYEWSADTAGLWRARTVSTPTTIQRGTLTADANGSASLLLPLTAEGRYRLTVSAASARASFPFTAGWWRTYAPPQIACSNAENGIVACKMQDDNSTR